MTDTPADERCESCHRLDPINCPCPPEDDPAAYPAYEVTSLHAATEGTADALIDIADERVRQVAKWGVQSWPYGTRRHGDEDYWASYFKAATDRAAADGSLTWRDILNEEVAEAYAETDPARLREELVQVAAVAVSWVEDIDRKAQIADAIQDARRAAAEGAALDAAIASGRLPLRQPGAAS